MDFWYHGTDEYFPTWATPPAKSKYKPELFPHQFISLSKDRELAAGAGNVTKGLCRAALLASASRLDLREKSADSKAVWEHVRQTEIGRVHDLLKTYELFVGACTSGEVLRIHTDAPAVLGELEPLQKATSNLTLPISERQKAYLYVQNFTRKWIEAVIAPAKRLGYQTVICAEIDRYRLTGPTACLNLYVFDPKALLAPEWVAKPDESLMK